MTPQIIKELNKKSIIFYDNARSRASAFNDGSLNYDNDFGTAVENFMQQKKNELENILSNYDGLEISLTKTDGTDTDLKAHKEFNNSSNQKIGKIFLNIDWFLDFRNKK